MYYGYQDDLYEKVNKNFKDFGLDIIKHNIQFVRAFMSIPFRSTHQLHLRILTATGINL